MKEKILLIEYMEAIFKTLFSIELQHDYYNQQASFDDIEIIPTEKTAKILNGCKIIYKTFSNKFTALIQTDADGKPFVMPENNSVFRFILKIKNSLFKNITALQMFNTAGTTYYFSNKADNKNDSILYLSKAMPDYNDEKEYEVGSLVKVSSTVNSVDEIFEAVKLNSKEEKHDTSDRDYWRKLENSRFPEYDNINFKHYGIYKGNVFLFSAGLLEAKKYIPEGVILNTNDKVNFREVNSLQYVTSEDIIGKDFICISKYDVRNHPEINPGSIFCDDGGTTLRKAVKFIAKEDPVEITNDFFWENAASQRFVISDDVIDFRERILGIADIFFTLPAGSDYSMLQGDNVSEIKYIIRFKNRITSWKYISQKGTVSSISDTRNIFAFKKNGNEFTSDKPVPLMKKPIHNFKLDSSAASIVTDIKCASDFITADSKTKSFTSEIFLFY